MEMGKDFWIGCLRQLTYVSPRDEGMLRGMSEVHLRLIEELLHRQAVKLNASGRITLDDTSKALARHALQPFVQEIYTQYPEVRAEVERLHGKYADECRVAVMSPQHVSEQFHVVVHDAKLKAQARELLARLAPTVTNVNHPNSVLAIVPLR